MEMRWGSYVHIITLETRGQPPPASFVPSGNRLGHVLTHVIRRTLISNQSIQGTTKNLRLVRMVLNA
jgi:hypothetical protein